MIQRLQKIVSKKRKDWKNHSFIFPQYIPNSVIIISDCMRRLQYYENHILPPQQNKLEPTISEIVWKHRKRLSQAFEPNLSEVTREMIRKEYRKILPKILQARKLFKSRFKALKGISENPAIVLEESMKIWQQFRACLHEKLYQINSGILNQLADKLAKKIRNISNQNLIAKSVRIYSSVMGSYQQKLSLFQRISPNIKTLSYIQSQMMQHSGDRELSSSIWVLLYIFSFAFVQMFGKYITKQQTQEVSQIIKAAFIRSLSIVLGNLEDTEQNNDEKKQTNQKKFQRWMQEIDSNRFLKLQGKQT